MHQTTTPNIANAKRAWFAVSAKNQVLGKLAVRIAVTLMGRHKTDFHPSVDQGDFVVVTDVEKLVVTGNKGNTKIYSFHSGFIGGLQEISFSRLHSAKPERVLELAVRRMLPKNRIARDMLSRLKIYKGSAHPHTAQAPAAL